MNTRRILKPFGSKPRLTPPPAGDLGASYPELRNYVLHRFAEADVGNEPFFHSYIERIFPEDFYRSLIEHMLVLKHGAKRAGRTQDNAAFVTDRYSLVECTDLPVRQLRAIFEDPEVKRTILSKYYLAPSDALISNSHIHEEFEYVFCAANRFQNIHVDIPPKVASFVFYLPEQPVSEEEELKNATVLYDKNLEPKYGARFRANSVCSFVSHFYSYHGFSSITERDVLVMFYIHEGEMEQWRRLRQQDVPPFHGVLDAIESKLRRHPLREYGESEQRIAIERAACRINAPKGRVMRG